MLFIYLHHGDLGTLTCGKVTCITFRPTVQSPYQSHLPQMELLDKLLNLFLSTAINKFFL